MGTSHHSRSRALLIALVAVPFALALLIPTSASAAGSDQPAPAPASGSAEQEPVSEPSEPPTSDPADPPPTEEPIASEESQPTEEQPPTDEPQPTEEPTPAEEPTEAPEPVVPVTDVESDSATAGPRRSDDPPPQVTICHRTADRTNPYNQITPTIPHAITGHANRHEGPIFTPDGPRPWGDIIPPIPGLPGGQNWPEGRDILDNGCEVEPDPGPLPDAVIGEVECVGTTPSLEVTVSNDADATADALFNIFVESVLEPPPVGPIAPGDSETVTVTGGGLAARENLTFTVEVRSGGDVIASEVISVDCAPPPPPGVEITAELSCGDDGAQGTLAVTNNGPDPVTVTVTVNGTEVARVVVESEDTGMGTANFSRFEDETITVRVFVDGTLEGTYTPTPDCELTPVPRVSVAGLECPPPTATVTLSNVGDPESTVVFTMLVDGSVVQESAPLFGGDTTTIVGDLTPYEDQTITVELRANGQVLGSRTLAVDCQQVSPGTGTGPAGAGAGPAGLGPGQAGSAGNDVLPATGAPFNVGLVATGLGLLVAGALLILAGRRGPRPARDTLPN